MSSEFDDLKRELAQVRAERDALRSFYQHASDTFYRTDNEGRVLFVSPSAATLVGRPVDAVLGTKIADYYVNPEARAGFLEAMQRGDGRVIGFEVPIRHADGSVRWVSTNAHVWHDSSGNVGGVEGAIRDIPAHADDERRDRVLGGALAAVQDGVAILDAELALVYANPAFFKLTGVTPHDGGVSLRALLASPARPENGLSSAMADLSSWHGAVSASPQTTPNRHLMLTYTPVTPPRELRPLHALLVHDAEQFDAITEQVVKAQSLEALAVLVGALAHDFNNLLASIQTNVYLARASLEAPDPDVVESLDTIQSQSERASALIRQLAMFARGAPAPATAAQLRDALAQAVAVARSTLSEDIALVLPKLASSLDGVAIPIDAELLSHVLVNLFANAAHATLRQPARELQLHCDYIADAASLRARYPRLQEGPLVRITVQDNGGGIAPETLPRVFEPFFTTKAAGAGTGLGLAMVYHTLRQHNGLATIESTLGEGTTVHLLLPAQLPRPTKPATLAPRPIEQASDGGNRTVLVVDDEPFVRRGMERIFRLAKYRVLTAADGIDALEVLSNHPEIELVVFDVVMPRLGGVEAALRARVQRPDLPILFATGHDRDGDLDRLPELGPTQVLHKPFDVDDLLAAAANAVNEGVQPPST